MHAHTQYTQHIHTHSRTQHTHNTHTCVIVAGACCQRGSRWRGNAVLWSRLHRRPGGCAHTLVRSLPTHIHFPVPCILSLSLSFSLCLSLSLSLAFSLSFSLSLSRTHTHTHTSPLLYIPAPPMASLIFSFFSLPSRTQAMAEDPSVSLLSFTGSTAVGRCVSGVVSAGLLRAPPQASSGFPRVPLVFLGFPSVFLSFLDVLPSL
jgi:hypothetical protein